MKEIDEQLVESPLEGFKANFESISDNGAYIYMFFTPENRKLLALSFPKIFNFNFCMESFDSLFNVRTFSMILLISKKGNYLD